MNPITNSEARGSYINIVAGSLGFVGAGATTAVSQLVSQGVNIGRVRIHTIFSNPLKKKANHF